MRFTRGVINWTLVQVFERIALIWQTDALIFNIQATHKLLMNTIEFELLLRALRWRCCSAFLGRSGLFDRLHGYEADYVYWRIVRLGCSSIIWLSVQVKIGLSWRL